MSKKLPLKVKSKVQAFNKMLYEFWQYSLLPTQLLISVFFILLILLFFISNNIFWENTQVPRLKKAAETQAQILADSQSAKLTEMLQRQDLSVKELESTLKQMLIVEDPAIGERFIKHIALELDYSVIRAAPNSLDMQQGVACLSCFQSEVLLTDREGNILGLASFAISGGYFDSLVEEMRPKLFAESSMILIMVVIVWVFVLFLFYRLQVAKRQIEASDDAKTRFMANVTHELRTPLNAILGYTQFHMKDQDLPDKLRQGMETIDQSATHLLMMINDILEYSRSNKDTINLIPSEIDMKSFLNSLVEMIRLRTQLKGLGFSYHFSEELPAVIIADEKRLRQILINLLANAVKFTKQGSITFSVTKQARRSHTQATLVFSVQDTGIGIDRKQLHKIFLPFQQIDNPINRAEGTGLGLSISQDLLSLMDSELRVQSSLGNGSQFSFHLEVPIPNQTKLAMQDKSFDEQVKITFPDDDFLQKMKEQLRRQNILGLRELVNALEQDSRYQLFLEHVRPFLKHYRFKQLLAWLEEYEE